MLRREETVLRAEFTGVRAAVDQLSATGTPIDPMVLGLRLRAHTLEAMLKWTAEATRRIRAASTASG